VSKKRGKLGKTIKEILAADIESSEYSEQNNEEYNELLQRQ
jgi:hypothetical protein